MCGAIVGLIMIITFVIFCLPFLSAAVAWVVVIVILILSAPLMGIVLYPIDKQFEEIKSKMSRELEGSPEYIALKKQYDETVKKHDIRAAIVVGSIMILLVIAIFFVL